MEASSVIIVATKLAVDHNTRKISGQRYIVNILEPSRGIGQLGVLRVRLPRVGEDTLSKTLGLSS